MYVCMYVRTYVSTYVCMYYARTSNTILKTNTFEINPSYYNREKDYRQHKYTSVNSAILKNRGEEKAKYSLVNFSITYTNIVISYTQKSTQDIHICIHTYKKEVRSKKVEVRSKKLEVRS